MYSVMAVARAVKCLANIIIFVGSASIANHSTGHSAVKVAEDNNKSRQDFLESRQPKTGAPNIANKTADWIRAENYKLESFPVRAASNDIDRDISNNVKHSQPIAAILDAIRHQFVWTFGSLSSRKTYRFLSRVGRSPYGVLFCQ